MHIARASRNAQVVRREISLVPNDESLIARRSPLAAKRQPYRLTTNEAARRFGVPRQMLVYLCRRVPGLAERQTGAGGPQRVRYLIDPPQLGLLLAERIDIAAAAALFGVPLETLTGYDPAHLGMLLAVLPLATKPHRRGGRRPTPRTSATGAGHASP
jgi:hypothetical protein